MAINKGKKFNPKGDKQRGQSLKIKGKRVVQRSVVAPRKSNENGDKPIVRYSAGDGVSEGRGVAVRNSKEFGVRNSQGVATRSHSKFAPPKTSPKKVGDSDIRYGDTSYGDTSRGDTSYGAQPVKIKGKRVVSRLGVSLRYVSPLLGSLLLVLGVPTVRETTRLPLIFTG
ncbi:hypothetical protein [Brunnivagina elsteri]|nr:hypothetical protein [Calothrix elsteri]